MDNDQHEIEQQLQPFQEACRREGYDVQCCLVRNPYLTPENFPAMPFPCFFYLKVIEPGIHERHYIDTWILFRRFLRETVDRSIHKRFSNFNIYPTLEATHLPIQPVPHQETTELFNRFLHIFHRVFIDIRNLSYNKDGTTMPMINEIADTFHELPGEMFCWGYGSDGIAVNALDTAYSRMERLDEKLRKWKIEEGFQWAVFFNYLNLLEMPYDQFVKELDSMSRQTGIVFDPDRKQMMRS